MSWYIHIFKNEFWIYYMPVFVFTACYMQMKKKHSQSLDNI